MELLPAIDLRGGRCVRLLRGDFDQETVYGDPFEVAAGYAAAGARWVHVVDLDAARGGAATNRALVLELARSCPLEVEAGGGVRDDRSAAELLENGVARVVLGTAAMERPGFARELAGWYPGRVAVGLDHRRDAASGRREVVVSGWERSSGVGLDEAIELFKTTPLAAFVVTDVSTDGTLAGPDLEGLAHVLRATSTPVIASGGVGTLEDLRALAALRREGRALAGVIAGRAILSGAIELSEAVTACSS